MSLRAELVTPFHAGQKSKFLKLFTRSCLSCSSSASLTSPIAPLFFLSPSGLLNIVPQLTWYTPFPGPQPPTVPHLENLLPNISG